MSVKQYQVKVVPVNGAPYHVYVGGFNNADAWRIASEMYPDCNVIIMKEV
jgi:hypothetical protein